MRYSPWLFLLLAIGCASKPQGKTTDANVSFDRPQALKNLKAQIEEARRAAFEEDHAWLAELTVPIVIEKLGGREVFINKLESMAKEMKGKGFRMKKFTIGEPSELVQVDGGIYAVVPSELELSGPRGVVGKQPSYMLALSKDGGVNWKFVDGAGVGSDRSKLKIVLPGFPEQLSLPAAQLPIWDKKPTKPAPPPIPPKTFARPRFTFEYPSTWKVSKDEDYDYLFSIDASLGAMIMFVIADEELDPNKTLALNVQAQSKRMTKVVKTEFDRWGKHNGKGMVLRGNTFFGLLPSTLRLFVFNAEGKTFTVIEGCPDDEKQQHAPGYKTIEESFRVLPEVEADLQG